MVDIKPEVDNPPVNLQLRVSMAVVLQEPTIIGGNAPVYVMMQTASSMDIEELAALLKMIQAHCAHKLRNLMSPKIERPQ